MGVVTGIVMAFQFGTNWSVLAERSGPIMGPLLGYEAFTAFILEATFFGVMLLGRDRVSPGVYFFACCMVSLGTMFSSFWILANNSLDAGAGRPRDRRRQDHSHRLARHRARAGDDGALAAYAAGRLPDHGHERYRHRRLVSVARPATGRSPDHAALGPRPGRGDHPGAAVFWPSHGPLRAQAPAGQVRRDRGPLAKPTARLARC